MGLLLLESRIDSGIHPPIVPQLSLVVKYGMFTMTALASTGVFASELAPCKGNPPFSKRGGIGEEAVSPPDFRCRPHRFS
jgi:hypothetical protein